MVVPRRDFRRAALPIISAGAVLAEKVFVHELGLHRPGVSMKSQRFARQTNQVFQYHSIVNGFRQ